MNDQGSKKNDNLSMLTVTMLKSLITWTVIVCLEYSIGSARMISSAGILPLIRMILQPCRVPGLRPAEAGGRGRQHWRIPEYQQRGGVREGLHGGADLDNHVRTDVAPADGGRET